MYAQVTNSVITTVGRLPRGADANGQWIEPLTADSAALCGWFPVVDVVQPADTPTTTHDRSVALINGTPTVVWTARPKTADELAADTSNTNNTTIRAQAETALVDNRTFLALASPTQAQTLAQVKALTRQTQGLIRLALAKFDAVD